MKTLVALFLFGVAAHAASPVAVTAVGHEYRQDDLPSITASPDGSLWVAWLSFSGERDDIGLRRFQNGRWGNLLWVPGVSGDVWLPQVAADSAHGVRVVWSQQVKGNWDLYARHFDPERQEWGALERLTSDPLPDINPRLWSDGKGRAALVWQGFRGKNSNIFLKTLEGDGWSPDIRVTSHAANDWEPAVALDRAGNAWVAYDSYKNGNYDVFLARAAGGHLLDAEIPVAASPAFEARATVAVDNADRVWVAWESGPANWGKDNGYIVRDRLIGTPLDGGGKMRAQVRWYENGRWREPAAPLAFPGRSSHHPHVFSDASGSVWVAAKVCIQPGRKELPPVDGYQPAYKGGWWEYAVTRFLGGGWTDAIVLPDSRGRLSTRISAMATADSVLHLAWPAEER
ncbi:MAG: hypothetical protein M1541_19510, partial [Acidobacteria bacterium]|nr:hypothetical protein [Acidobacteriota bacterium]